ncbi:sulfate transporter family protein [Aurantimonas sp. A2-1-M11]|uniref:sulfate transporter family protein n=1 Tax=Aurantimonas sp. A2-1-M11 TaxID=3113712 RepID=UPI002F927821
MIFTAARLALADIFSPPFRAALWKTLGLTAVVLVALWFGIGALAEIVAVPFLSNLFPDDLSWIDEAGTAAGWAAGLLLAVLLAFLIGPISAIIASLFLDDVAMVVERESYPAAPTGTAMALLPGIILSVKFFGVVILGNLLALLLLLVPGVNIAAFFLVNGYLLGREYFEFAAMRYRTEDEAKAVRSRHGGTVFVAGLLIACFLAVPVVNLLTPLFAAALMVHLHQRIAARTGGLPAPGDGPARRVRGAGEAAPERRSS